MENLFQQDVELYGPSGGPREYGEMMGRENGGGWINGPLAYTDHDGKGVWAQPPARDGEKNFTTPQPHMGAYGDDEIFDMVRSWAGSPEADGGWK